MSSLAQRRAAYDAFLRAKMPRAEMAGFEPPSPCMASLFPHQRDICEWAIRGGRRAIFANFGLGKTRMHLQIALWVVQHAALRQAEALPHSGNGNGKYLIVAPLGVRHVFTMEDGPAMGLDVQYVATDADVARATSRILITNYERVRDGQITLSQFAGAGLDEASCLRSYGSKTYQEFLHLFKAVAYRFVFTATPSPNRHKELIHYGGFLGVMDTGEALTRFFQRNSEQANELTLYPHMEQQFWYWLSTWSVFIQRPSDLGYSDEGYDLPALNVHWHCVGVDHTKAWRQADSWGQFQLLQDQSTGLAQGAEVKRDTIDARLRKACEIMVDGGQWAVDGGRRRHRHWLLWHDLEAERAAIHRMLPSVTCVWGTMDEEERERRILAFGRGEFPVLATKPIIAGSGCNFQRHCADAIFLGVGYKFNDFIQAVHRIHRFQQTREVNVHVIYCESEQAIMEALKRKWRQHDETMATMSALLRERKLTCLEMGMLA